MAIVDCSECGSEVSDQAEACPNCGFPVRERERRRKRRKQNQQFSGKEDVSSAATSLRQDQWKTYLFIGSGGGITAIVLLVWMFSQGASPDKKVAVWENSKSGIQKFTDEKIIPKTEKSLANNANLKATCERDGVVAVSSRKYEALIDCETPDSVMQYKAEITHDGENIMWETEVSGASPK